MNYNIIWQILGLLMALIIIISILGVEAEWWNDPLNCLNNDKVCWA